MKKSEYFLISFCTFLWLFTSGCVQYIARYDGLYEGKIVDAETRVPIEGVVVLGVWYKEAPTVAGAVSSYYDARETITDGNGDFKIPGKGLKILSDVGAMNVLIFKSGYEYIGLWPWETFRNMEKILWEGEKAIIPLRKLTMAERRESATFPHDAGTPEEKAKMMIEEMRKERKERGLD